MQQKIEDLVRARRQGEAKKKIQRFLKDHDDDAAIFKACGWYRRLGLYREGYLLVVPKSWRLAVQSTATPEGMHLLWCARFLNLMGAREHALQILSRLQFVGSAPLAIAGDIYFRAYEFEKSCQAFEEGFALETNHESWKARMAMISHASSLQALGENSRALEKLSTVKANDHEYIVRAYALNCEGRCWAGLGEFKKAHEKLSLARELFPGNKDTEYDARIAHALAYVKAKLGRIDEAKLLFREAAKVLSAPGMSTEIFFENLWFMHQVGLLQKKEIPYLAGYPGLPDAFLKRAGMPPFPFFRAKKEKIRIMPSRREWTLRGKPRFGITKEVLLLAALKQSGHHGISLTRLKPLLWPDEPGSFGSLELRIFKLLKEIKTKYKFSAEVVRGIVFLSEQAHDQVSVETSLIPLPTQFYESHSSFTANEFASHYGFSKAQAARLLKSEVELGHLVAEVTAGKTALKYSLEKGF